MRNNITIQKLTINLTSIILSPTLSITGEVGSASSISPLLLLAGEGSVVSVLIVARFC